jgi:hypothetical protein
VRLRVGRGSARAAARDVALPFNDVIRAKGKGAPEPRHVTPRCPMMTPRPAARAADTELWRPCWPDVAKGHRGGVGSLALPRCLPPDPKHILLESSPLPS